MATKLRICLTGGIGSGKSAAADEFSKLGIDIIDTDVIARECVVKGSSALDRIADHFGQTVMDDKQQLNRQQLRDIIFNDPEQKRWLESLLHPIIREKTLAQAEKSQSPYCIIVIPLYTETQTEYQIDKVIVVDTPTDIQAKRVMERDAISHEQALNIIEQQASRAERLKGADIIIENGNDLQHLKKQVLDINQNLLKIIKGT